MSVNKKSKKDIFFLSCLFVCFLPHELYSHTVCFKFCIDGSLVSILWNLQNVWLLWKAVEILLFRSEVVQMLYQWSGIVKVVRISKRLRMRVTTTPQHWSRAMVFSSMQYTWGCPLWHCYDTIVSSCALSSHLFPYSCVQDLTASKPLDQHVIFLLIFVLGSRKMKRNWDASFAFSCAD